MTDDIKDDDKLEVEGDVLEGEEGEEKESAEPDFAPAIATSALDEADDLDADPHSSFDPVAPHEEDPHLDIYGFGVPQGFNGDDDEEEDEEEESYGGAEFEAF